MRLKILEHGHTRKQKALMWLARRYVGTIPGPILTMSYRPAFFGKHMASILQRSMRGATCFSIGETELMCVFVSHRNGCQH